MKKIKNKDYSLFNYRHAIPIILQYEILSKMILLIFMAIYSKLRGLLLWNLGRPAITSGDMSYFMYSWQGWILILSGFLVLVIYTIFDINATILISDRIIHGKEIRTLQIIKEAFLKASYLKSPLGIFIILYVSLAAPLTGASFGISLTSSFSIPDFIMSVINSRFALNALYNICIIALFLIGFMHIFIFHFVLLDGQNVKEALLRSRQIMRSNWKDFLKNYVLFILQSAGIVILILLFAYLIPSMIIHSLNFSTVQLRSIMVFLTFLTYILLVLFGLLFLYYLMMKLTLLYERYTGHHSSYDKELFETTKKKKSSVWFKAIFVVGFIILIILSIGCGIAFDNIFPRTSSVKVIAHRAGGDLAHENTILGMKAAKKHHADYAEIDVQRTKDGHYIINHDETFKRSCDDPRTPGEMTLKEIKKLKVAYALKPATPPTQVATIEEFLDSSMDLDLPLLIELKGKSADKEMADDLYQMVIERNMIDQVMFIGLNYDLLDYVETKYPEITTAYLCFFGFGEIQNMNVDVLLLEAETATDGNIDKIHNAGKKIGVWTIDDYTSLFLTLATDADYVITDKIKEVENTREFMSLLPDEARIIQSLFPRH